MENKRVVFCTKANFSIVPDKTGGPGTLEGYAMVWNCKSTDRGGYKVSLMPNSARFTPDTYALLNHNFDNLLGGFSNNTLSIANDNFGAKVSIQLANTQLGKDVAENVRSGLIKGMSFAMLNDGAAKFTTAKDADGDEVDTFSEFNCDEVTVTPIPAFPQTSIGVAGPSPFAQAIARENFSRVRKELDTDSAKYELYGLHLHALTLAEISDTSNREPVK